MDDEGDAMTGGPIVSLKLGGLNAVVRGIRAIVGGLNAIGNGAGSVVIGANAKDGAGGGASDVAIGEEAETGYSQSQTIGAGEAVAVGWKAKAYDWRSTAVGALSHAAAVSATAFGRGALALATHSVAVGRGAIARLPGDITLGNSGSPVRVLFNNAGFSRFYDTGSFLKRVIVDRFAPNLPISIQGISGLDTTENPLPDRPGGHLVLAGGAGTGTAEGGSVVLAYAPKGEASGTDENLHRVGAWVNADGYLVLVNGWEMVTPDGSRVRITLGSDHNFIAEVIAAPQPIPVLPVPPPYAKPPRLPYPPPPPPAPPQP